MLGACFVVVEWLAPSFLFLKRKEDYRRWPRRPPNPTHKQFHNQPPLNGWLMELFGVLAAGYPPLVPRLLVVFSFRFFSFFQKEEGRSRRKETNSALSLIGWLSWCLLPFRGAPCRCSGHNPPLNESTNQPSINPPQEQQLQSIHAADEERCGIDGLDCSLGPPTPFFSINSQLFFPLGREEKWSWWKELASGT